MKNTINNLFLAIFLAFISQGIQAQFDDIYYDPDRIESSKEVRKDPKPDPYIGDESNETSQIENEYSYDDEYTEWEDQDYYYSSRIKRFHRPYRGFDYYNGVYVDNYYYDPFDFNPWFYDRDIYVSYYGYNNYYNWRRWQLRPMYSYSYWNQWDYYMGWSNCPYSYSYNYWPNNYYSGYYNNYWSNNYYNHHYYNGGNNHWNNNGYYNNDNNPNGTYYGSRRFGLTNTSKRGPVRLASSSPRVFTETPGTSVTPTPDRSNPRRVVQSADGDVLKPGPVTKPERSRRVEELPGTRSNPANREEVNPRKNPRELPGMDKAPEDRTRPEPRKEFKPERKESIEENKPEFKPERIRRDEPRMERSQESAPRIDVPKERSRESFQPPRESRPEPRQERRQEYNSNSRSESSGSRSENNSNSGGHRRSPR